MEETREAEMNMTYLFECSQDCSMLKTEKSMSWELHSSEKIWMVVALEGMDTSILEAL